MARKKRLSKRTAARKRKPAVKPSVTRRTKTRHGKKAVGRKKRTPATRRGRGSAAYDVAAPSATRGLGSEAGGQAGDTEGLSRAELADSESVEELVEEGQAFEAGVISGVENAPEADRGGVRTRQVPEDDVPQEYLDED